MVEQHSQLNVAILAVPEVTASTLYGMFDLMSSPGRDWPFIVKGEAGEQCMRPYVVARSTNGERHLGEARLQLQQLPEARHRLHSRFLRQSGRKHRRTI